MVELATIIGTFLGVVLILYLPARLILNGVLGPNWWIKHPTFQMAARILFGILVINIVYVSLVVP